MARIAILGCGKLGESLLSGLLSAGWRDIVVTARRQERADELAERHGVETTLVNRDAVRGADIVVLAAKPQDLEALLEEAGSELTPEQTVLSVAAAIPTSAIERHLPEAFLAPSQLARWNAATNALFRHGIYRQQSRAQGGNR